MSGKWVFLCLWIALPEPEASRCRSSSRVCLRYFQSAVSRWWRRCCHNPPGLLTGNMDILSVTLLHSVFQIWNFRTFAAHLSSVAVRLRREGRVCWGMKSSEYLVHTARWTGDEVVTETVICMTDRGFQGNLTIRYPEKWLHLDPFTLGLSSLWKALSI